MALLYGRAGHSTAQNGNVPARAESMLVCGEYARLRSRGQLEGLPTLMMYSFYAAQCCGAIVVMIDCVGRLLTQRVLAAIAMLRLPFVASIYVYNRLPLSEGLFGDDYQVSHRR